MSDDYKKARGCALDEKKEITELAELVAIEILYHIDQMYPEMWVGAPKSARISIRNTIINRVEAHWIAFAKRIRDDEAHAAEIELAKRGQAAGD